MKSEFFRFLLIKIKSQPIELRRSNLREGRDLSQFAKKVSGSLFEIECLGKLDAASAEIFSNQSKAWIMNSADFFVLDLSKAELVTRDFYRAVILLKQVLKPDGKVIFSIGATEALRAQMRVDGVEAVFSPVDSRAELEKRMTKPEINKTALIQSFTLATKKVFESQGQTSCDVKLSYMRSGHVLGTVICAEIPLRSEGLLGKFFLCLSTPVFLKIFENMFEEKRDVITPDMKDAASELVNIIYGMAKTDLNPKGFSFQPTLPTVACGEDLISRQSRTKSSIVIPFDSSAGPFHIELEFEK